MNTNSFFLSFLFEIRNYRGKIKAKKILLNCVNHSCEGEPLINANKSMRNCFVVVVGASFDHFIDEEKFSHCWCVFETCMCQWIWFVSIEMLFCPFWYQKRWKKSYVVGIRYVQCCLVWWLIFTYLLLYVLRTCESTFSFMCTHSVFLFVFNRTISLSASACFTNIFHILL